MARAPRAARLSALASHLGRGIDGDGDPLIQGVASLERAGPEDLAFIRSTRYLAAARASRAAAFVAPPTTVVDDRPVLSSEHPVLDFARAVTRLMHDPGATGWTPGDEAVANDAQIDPSARIGPGCIIGAGSRVGPGTVLHARVTIYPDVQIGSNCEFHAGVVVREGTRVGDHVTLHAGVVLGSDGFGYIGDENGQLVKVPQVGIVVIEDEVEIGANSTVDRATLDETRIRRGVRIDNLVQIAHNCDVGEGSLIAAGTGLGGSTIVGRGVVMMGQTGVVGHVEIGDGALVGAQAGVTRDVRAGARVYGTPAVEDRRWHRSVAALSRLPDALRRLRALERRLGADPSSDAGDGPPDDDPR